MPSATIKSEQILRRIETVRHTSIDLLQTIRETAKGEHPGQWPAFGSLIDVREVLGKQLQEIADGGVKLQKAIGHNIGPASWSLLRIARNVYWFVEFLRESALPAILDVDLNDVDTQDYWSEKLTVEPDSLAILKKLGTPVSDPDRSENRKVQSHCDLKWQQMLAERAAEIDAQLDDLTCRIDAELDALSAGYRAKSSRTKNPVTVYRHDTDSFSLDGKNQFNVPSSGCSILNAFEKARKSLSDRELRDKANSSNPSQDIKRLREWENGKLKKAIRMPTSKGMGYFIHVVVVPKC